MNKIADFTILVVEDNAVTSKLLKNILEAEDFAVLAAASGQQALELMQRTTPDLIIQDFILPDMDGVELNRQLRMLFNGKDIPILGLLGFLNRMQEIPATN